jgi:hypothetical protein
MFDSKEINNSFIASLITISTYGLILPLSLGFNVNQSVAGQKDCEQVLAAINNPNTLGLARRSMVEVYNQTCINPSEDSSTDNASDANRNAAAMQRYLMNNQTDSYPYKRSKGTQAVERENARLDNQIRAARGQAAARERARRAGACMISPRNCN